MKRSSQDRSLSEYTFEDYLSDFELDYLGFDGVPKEPDSALRAERTAETAFEAEDDDHDDDLHAPCLRFQK